MNMKSRMSAINSNDKVINFIHLKSNPVQIGYITFDT